MNNIFILKKKDNNLLFQEVISATESILTKVDNLIKNTWINEIDKHGLEFNKNFITGISKIKDTTRLFIVENESGEFIASAALFLNEKIDDCAPKHKINILLPFPNYSFALLAVDKDYQGMGIGNQLMKYICDFVKTTNIKSIHCFVSKNNRKNVENHGFVLLDRSPTIFRNRPGNFYPYILNL